MLQGGNYALCVGAGPCLQSAGGSHALGPGPAMLTYLVSRALAELEAVGLWPVAVMCRVTLSGVRLEVWLARCRVPYTQ